MSLRSNLESLSRFSSQSSVIIFLAFVFTLLAANGNPGLAQGFRVESKEAPSVVEGGSFCFTPGKILNRATKAPPFFRTFSGRDVLRHCQRRYLRLEHEGGNL